MKRAASPPTKKPGRERRVTGHAQGRQSSDPYLAKHKPPEAAVCPQCGGVFHDGRWTWRAPSSDALTAICPACHRINDEFPAGIVVLHGNLVREHRHEIEHLIRHQEEAEKAEHPLNRIMSVENTADDTLTVTTTDIHLPRRIGEAMKHAYDGECTMSFSEDSYFIRVDWSGR